MLRSELRRQGDVKILHEENDLVILEMRDLGMGEVELMVLFDGGSVKPTVNGLTPLRTILESYRLYVAADGWLRGNGYFSSGRGTGLAPFDQPCRWQLVDGLTASVPGGFMVRCERPARSDGD